eukprot:scaffold133339_cov52-Phaeocystis_antarctica.AAC.2
MCAIVPQRALTISRKVWQLGDLRLTSMARMPKSSTWRLQGGGRRRGGRWKGDGREMGDGKEMGD